MAEGTEVDERVDLDEDNYMEEIDEFVEDQVDEDGADRAGIVNADEHAEEEDDEETNTMAGLNDQSPEPDMGDGATEPEGDEEKLTVSVNEEDRENHTQLLSLPPHGSEVFIGGLARDTLEDDLRDLCEPIGEVTEIRLVKDKTSGEAKGYAFVVFRTKDDAQKAIEEFQSKEFKGKTLRCSISETKHRLFIGNVPKSWTEDEFRKIIEEVGPGIENVELIKDPQNPNRNRGFAFVLYYNNACADYSRQKMTNASFKLDGNNPTVSWADPKSTPDHSAAAQVKALYVKNIPENSTTEQLKEIFQRHGEVTKVVMPPSKAGSKRDFGFVYYAERSSALKAVKDTEKYEIDGQVLEVVLAKPQAERKTDGMYPYNSGMPQSHLPHSGYGGFSGHPYGSTGAGYGVANNYQQPMIYGRGPMPSGMQMVPMVLPDGRIGYVLQQPGVQMPGPRPRRNDNRSNGSSGGRAGSSGDEGNRGRRYRPY